jgi:hypothetical protein
MLARPARAASLFFLAAALTSAPALAGEAGGVAARAVIQRQLEAFQQGDADGAFALATPELKAAYANSDNFMASVRSGETPFFTSRMTEFHDLAIHGDNAAQSIVLVDQGSYVWNVVYELARQPDGSWLVDGVVVAKSDATDA